jgi:glycosyltransferase involved in cell wall biosynthesis
LVSVLTPTHDRAHTLPRLYESLATQTYPHFEWLVIDDGSADGTRELVGEWMAQDRLTIRYFRQDHRGKHVALNRGIQEARGDFFTIVDSDDVYLPHAWEFLVSTWFSIPEEERCTYCGVAALCADPEGRIVGTPFPRDVLDSDYIEIRTRYGVKGDKAELYKTDVVRAFPLYPEFDGERFVLEALLWNRIAAASWRMRFCNEVVRVVEYLPDGLTAVGPRKTVRSPRGAKLYFKEFIHIPRPLPFRVLLYHYANYFRFSLHCRTPLRQVIAEAPSKLLLMVGSVPGWLVYFRDRWVMGEGASTGC